MRRAEEARADGEEAESVCVKRVCKKVSLHLESSRRMRHHHLKYRTHTE